MAVKSVIDDRQTSVTETVESFIAAKKSIQWPPTSAPVAANLSSLLPLILYEVLLKLKYKNSEAAAIATLYQTNCTAAMEINSPKILVNPHINTVKCNIMRFLFIPVGGFFSGIILVLCRVNIAPTKPKEKLGINTDKIGGKAPFFCKYKGKFIQYNISKT